jgi:hypothetical protein
MKSSGSCGHYGRIRIDEFMMGEERTLGRGLPLCTANLISTAPAQLEIKIMAGIFCQARVEVSDLEPMLDPISNIGPSLHPITLPSALAP